MKKSYVVNVLFAVLCGLSPRLSEAATYYWDVNGTASGFSTVVGTWDTANNFWNTDSTGGASGSLTNTTDATMDLIIPQATTQSGTLTVSGTQNASSLAFAANVGGTLTLSGGTAVTIGGTGASSGVFNQSSAANTISTALTLKSDVTAFNFSNSSSGLLTIGAVNGAATTGIQTITVGSSSSGGMTLNGIIGNGGAGGKVGLTINNTSTGVTTLTANNTFTGNILISAGKLNADLKQTGANPTSGSLGNAQTVGRTLTISAGATLDFTKADVLGNENTSPNLTIIANGGTIKNTTTGSNAGFNLLGPVQLNGGTLSSTGGGYGDNYYAYPGFALGGTVTVGGSAVSTISTSGNYNSGATGSAAGIGLQTAAKGSTTFDVADAVSGSDLNVTGILQNWGTNFPNLPGALIKTGIGTMTLSGTNTYTGSTTVNAGTLSLVGGKALADTTSLYTTNSAKIHIAANETVNKLYLNGLEAQAGTWGSSVSAATYKWDDYFTGTAVLTVSSGTGIIPPKMGTLFLFF